MDAPTPIRPHLAELAERAPGAGTDSERVREYAGLKKQAKEIISADPSGAANQFEFMLQNGSASLEMQHEMTNLLYHLGGHDGYRGKAVELLGKLMQGGDPELIKVSERAVKGVLKRTKGRGLKPDAGIDPTEEKAKDIVAH
jgi:hypothetical protein